MYRRNRMTATRFEPEPARTGRKPLLTPEQDAEVYEAYKLRATLTNTALRQRFGLTNDHPLVSALARESARRAGRRA